MARTAGHPAIANICVAETSKEKAQIEQFTYRHENFMHKHLGVLCGFFVVNGSSKDEQYLPHQLAARIKTGYFHKFRNSSEVNFAYALEILNAEIDQHGSFDHEKPLPKRIDALLCVYAEDTLYFSVCGNAHILLLRDRELIDITPEKEDNLTEAFVDLSSGKVCIGDKIILTSKELLELVSQDELARTALSMSNHSFIQFVTTALTNECLRASTHIIDIIPLEQENTKDLDESQPTKTINAFSAQAYSRKSETYIPTEKPTPEEETEPKDYTDKRTGHIYVHGNPDDKTESNFLTPITEYTEDVTSTLGKKSGRYLQRVKNQLPAKIATTKKKATHTSRKLKQNSAVLFYRVRDKFTTHHHDEYENVEEARSVISDTAQPLANPKKHKKARILRRQRSATRKTSPQNQTTTTNKSETPPPIRRVSVDIPRPSTISESHETTSTNTKTREESELETDLEKPAHTNNAFKEKLLKAASPILNRTSPIESEEHSIADKTKAVSAKISRVSATGITALLAGVISVIVTIAGLHSKIPRFTKKDEPKKKDKHTTKPKKKKTLSAHIVQLKRNPEKGFLEAYSTIILITVLSGLVVYMLWWTLIRTNPASTTPTTEDAAEQSTENVEQDSETQDEEPIEEGLTQLEDPRVLSEIGGLSVARIGNSTYIINPEGITTQTNTSSSTTPLPAGFGAIAHSTYMPSERVFYVITTANTLHSYNVQTRTFSQEKIPATISFDDISALGSKDQNLLMITRDNIISYPKTATGFDGGETLLDEPRVLIDAHQIIAHDDAYYVLTNRGILFVSGGNGILIGNLTNTQAKSGDLDANTDNLWILDPSQTAIILTERDTFRILETYKHPLLANATSLSTDGTSFYITTEDSTLIFEK